MTHSAPPRHLAELVLMVGAVVKHPAKPLGDLRVSLLQFGQVETLIVNRRANPPAGIGSDSRAPITGRGRSSTPTSPFRQFAK